MNDRTRFDSRSAAQAAAEWLVRLDAGPVDAGTAAEFRTWLAAHPEHEALFARCEAAVFLTDRLRGDADLRWAFEEAAEIARRGVRRSRVRALWAWLARPALAWSVAGVAVAVAIAAIVYRPGWLAPPAQRLPTPVSAVQLPGSVVVDARSVAVLPFVTADGGTPGSEDAERFAATLHGQIATQLASVPGFHVIEPRAVMAYSNLGLAPRDIAAQLGVRGVVQGSVQFKDDNVRVNLQLTDASNDALLLEDDYDRAVADLGSIESDIATDIAFALADASRIQVLER